MSRKVKLKDLGVIVTGNTPKTIDYENFRKNDICFFKPSDITNGSINDLSNSEYYISEYARKKSRILPKGSVLITCIGIIGKIGILTTEAACNQQINGIIPDAKKVINRYLAYNLLSMRKGMQDSANAAVVPIMNKSQFSDLEIDLRPMQDQKRIVDTLDKVNQLIDLRKQQIEKMDLLVKSQFIEMFGDPEINPIGWSVKSLGELGTLKNGMNFNSHDKGVTLNCLGVGDFQTFDKIERTDTLPTISLNSLPSEEFMLRDKDIVFVRSNGNKALVGRSVVVYPGKTPTTFSGFCIRFRLMDTNINSTYLIQLLHNASLKATLMGNGRGANITNLNQQMLSSLQIPIPTLDLQNQFEDFVEHVDKSKFEIQNSLEKLGTLEKALVQKYFG